MSSHHADCRNRSCPGCGSESEKGRLKKELADLKAKLSGLQRDLSQQDDARVRVEFEEIDDAFVGFLCLNPFTGKLVFDNDEGQFDVNEYVIKNITFLK